VSGRLLRSKRGDFVSEATLDSSRGERISIVGLLINAGLALIKLVAGLLGHSYALVADAVESMADIFGSLIVWSGLRIASQPPDAEHPYGHGKAEALAALIVGLMLVGAAIGIGIQAVQEIMTPHYAPAAFTLWVLFGVIAVKETMYRVAKRTAHDINSSAVLADAWHHRSDAITSVAAAVGISIALIGGENYKSADDYAALFAAGVILFNAFRLIIPTLNELMDAEPTELIRQVREIAEQVDGVDDVEKIFARKSGMRYWVDMHVRVDPKMPVIDAHGVAHRVQDVIRDEMPNVQAVLTHVEPSGDAIQAGST
jgi:cation diffusion facilitator family transporter